MSADEGEDELETRNYRDERMYARDRMQTHNYFDSRQVACVLRMRNYFHDAKMRTCVRPKMLLQSFELHNSLRKLKHIIDCKVSSDLLFFQQCSA